MVWLLRHGTLIHRPHMFVGQQDIPLGPEGHRQALFWREELAHVPFAACVCSDLSRCVMSAKTILQGRHIPVFQDAGLREICLGSWEGLDKTEVEARFPGALAQRGSDMAHYRPHGGESFADLALRVFPAFDAWVDRYHGHSGQHGHTGHTGHPILVIAHAGVNRLILARYMALSMAELLHIPQPYAALTTLSMV